MSAPREMALAGSEAFAAFLYDVQYGNRRYTQEVADILRIVVERLGRKPKKLLDAACGTGQHLGALAEALGKSCESMAGFDISNGMINAARGRVDALVDKSIPIELFQGDMRSFRCPGGDHQFEAVTCSFGSIGYMTNEGDLLLALQSLKRACAPGGVVVVEPWFGPEEWESGSAHAWTRVGPNPLVVGENESLQVRSGWGREKEATFQGVESAMVSLEANSDQVVLQRMHVSRFGADRRTSVMDMHYSLAVPQRGVFQVTESHVMGLFSDEQYKKAFAEAGFVRVERIDSEPETGRLILSKRGLYVASSS